MMQTVGDGMPKETPSYTNWGIISTFAMIPIFSDQWNTNGAWMAWTGNLSRSNCLSIPLPIVPSLRRN